MLKSKIFCIIFTLALLSAAIMACEPVHHPIIKTPVSEESSSAVTPPEEQDENTTEKDVEDNESVEPEPPTIPYTDVRIIRDIEFGRVDGIPLMLDMYIPDTPVVEPMPVVVFIHGGGWQNGDKYPSRVESLARRGFLGISINYRLSGVATFPAAVEDCKCAIRWVRAHAEKYGADPDKIGIWGGSAGGHLVMFLGCADKSAGFEGNSGWGAYSSRVQAVCSYFGPSDFQSMGEYGGLREDSAEVKFLGGTIEEIPEVYISASPITYVSADDPPLLMVHGDKDIVVGLRQSKVMLEAYQQAGLEVTLITVKNAGHGFKQAADSPIEPSIEEIEQAVLDFFVKYLVMAD